MAGDDLTICLFLVGLGATFGLETMKAETAPRRALFGMLGSVFLLTGLAWLHVKPLWPPLTDAITAIATNPVSWFVVGMFALAIIAFQPRRLRSEPAPLPPQRAVPVPIPSQSAPLERAPKPKKEAPREFVDTTPEYLFKLRNQENLTRVQTDRMIAPYIGKWIKVTGIINEIYEHAVVLRPEGAEDLPRGLWHSISLAIDPAWRERFHILEREKKISAVGQIAQVYFADLALEHGELDS